MDFSKESDTATIPAMLSDWRFDNLAKCASPFSVTCEESIPEEEIEQIEFHSIPQGRHFEIFSKKTQTLTRHTRNVELLQIGTATDEVLHEAIVDVPIVFEIEVFQFGQLRDEIDVPQIADRAHAGESEFRKVRTKFDYRFQISAPQAGAGNQIQVAQRRTDARDTLRKRK